MRTLEPEDTSNYNINSTYRAPQTNSYIRLFNASPNIPAVDVYANDVRIAQNLSYKQFTQYIPISGGNFSFAVYPAGEKAAPLLIKNSYIPPNSVFTMPIIGAPPNLYLFAIPEPTSAQKFGRSCIRFANLSPGVSSMDLTNDKGSIIFKGIDFRHVTDYACIPAGTHTLQFKSSGTNNVVLTIPNVRLLPNSYYTIYSLGSTEDYLPLEAIVAQEPRQ